MTTSKEFLKAIKTEMKKNGGDDWSAINKVSSTVKRGEEDDWDIARLAIIGLTSTQAAQKAKAAAKRIEKEFNSKEVQGYLKVMHGSKDFYSNNAVA